MFADENVIKIKHDVLYEVAKAALEGNLEADPWPKPAVPLLYLQREGDHPAENPPCRGQSSGVSR